jgi:hypothetical protein
VYAIDDRGFTFGEHPMLKSLVHAFEEAAKADPTALLYGPIINVGAVGVCLIVLAYYFKIKDARYETRIDERLKREAEFQEKYVGMVTKQQEMTEKFSTTLGSVVTLMTQILSKLG